MNYSCCFVGSKTTLLSLLGLGSKMVHISDFLSHRNLALARVPLELIKEKFIIHGLANTPTTNAKADTFLKEYYSNCHYFASSIMI